MKKRQGWRQQSFWLLALAVALAGLLAACEKEEEDSYGEDPEELARARAMKMNPASLNCKKAGGTLLILKRGDGGEYGICRFKDGRECEEWAMFLSFCPVGGISVADIADPAARFCALRGGFNVPAASGTPAACKLPGGATCGTDDLYSGRCEPNR